VLLYVGRLYAEKHAEKLLETAARLRTETRPIEVVVIGDGAEMARVRAAAGGAPDVHLLGEVRDSVRIAEYMRVATALVIPGKVGLAVTHAFAHGVPVATRSSPLHAPEFEYLVDGVNGVVTAATDEAFDSAIAKLIDDPQWRDQLAAGALRTADDLSLEAMAQRFEEGIAAAISSRRGD